MEKILYTAEALSTGDGRNGHVRTPDGRVDLDMATPPEMGGSGEGSNPEQLFAAGYAACFHSALKWQAGLRQVDATGSTVGGRVSLGPTGEGMAMGLAVELEIVIPGAPLDRAREIAEAAHQVCPYSNATRGNIQVTLTVVED